MTTLYLAMILFAVLAMFICDGKRGNKEKAYLIICFAIMLVLHVCFNPEYSDNYYYKIGYQEFRSMSFGQVLTSNAPSLKAETGYRVLCKLLTYISPSWFFGIFVISVMMLSGYYVTIKRYSPVFWLSVLLIMTGPFLQSLFVLRQHLAMGVILLTYPFIIERKLLPYLLLCLIAFSFHQTAAIFLPTYFLYNLRNTKIVYAILILALLSLYYYFSFFLTSFASMAMDTATYGEGYLEFDQESGSNNKMALLMWAVLLLRIFLMKKDFFKEGINRLLSITMILGVIISTVGIGFVATPRLNMYFTSTAFLYIPNTFQYAKDKPLRLILSLGYLLFILYFFIRSANENNMSDFWFFSK